MAITYHVIDALRSQVDSMVGPLKGTGWLWLIIPPSIICIIILASLMAQMVKKLPAMRETRFDHWVGKIPWRREWLPTPVFLPGYISMDRGVWWATMSRVTKSWPQLKLFRMHACAYFFPYFFCNWSESLSKLSSCIKSSFSSDSSAFPNVFLFCRT